MDGNDSSESSEKHGHKHKAYQLSRRISLACTHCRQKKARCTGERPQCLNCRRLAQECHYGGDGRRLRASQLAKPPGSTEDDWISSRFDNIDSQLTDLKAQINCISALRSTDINYLPGGSSERKAPQNFDPEYPPFRVVETLLDSYFKYCHNQPYSFFHESSLRLQHLFANVPPYLLFAIIASALRFPNELFTATYSSQLAETYADRAWQLLAPKCFGNEDVNLNMVQAITLITIFDFTRGGRRYRSAWVKLGIAVRIAQDLRLMNEASYVFMGATEQEERRRTFWSLYLLDRLISCGRDRPIAIADSSCNLQLPCSEEAWSVGRHEKTLMLGHFVNWKASESTRVGTFALVIVLSSLLARCAKVMLQVDEGRHPDPPWSPQSEYASIYSDLLRLEAAVDLLRPFTEVLQQHQTTTACALQNLAHYFFARLIYYLCHCLLSHPFLLRGIVASIGLKAPAGFLPHAFTSGLHNATQLINLIETVQDSMSLANSSFSGYCCVIAGTYHALNASATNDDAARSQHLQYLRSALDHLKFLSQYYDNSGFMWTMLEHFSTISGEYSSLIQDGDEALPGDPIALISFWPLIDYNNMSRGTEHILSEPLFSSLAVDQIQDGKNRGLLQ